MTDQSLNISRKSSSITSAKLIQQAFSPEINVSAYYTFSTDGKSPKYTCNDLQCQKTFRFKSEADRHMLTHIDLRSHKCPYDNCEKSFKRLPSLHSHIRGQHTGETPLTCSYPLCSQTFSTDAKLKYHMLQHLEVKPHHCSYPGCDKSFLTVSQLKKHENSPSVHKCLQKVYSKRVDNSQIDSYSTKFELGKSPNDEDNVVKKIKSQCVTTNKDFAPIYNSLPSYCQLVLLTKMIQSMDPTNLQQYSGDHNTFQQLLQENQFLKGKLTNAESFINILNTDISGRSPSDRETDMSNSDQCVEYAQREFDSLESASSSEVDDVDKYFFSNDIATERGSGVSLEF